MTYDVAIIGSGLGGLVCGKLLSDKGLSVIVLERDGAIGGCLQSYKRYGELHDTGFHYVGGLDEGAALNRVFKRLGLMDLPWQRLDMDGFDRVTLGHRTFCFHQGFDDFAASLGDDFPQERQAIARFTEEMRQVDAKLLDWLRPEADNESYCDTAFGEGAYDHLRSLFADPLVVNVLAGASMKLELRRDTLPWSSWSHAMASYIRSSWRLVGGGDNIAHRLARGIMSNGGQVLIQCNVVGFTATNGQLTTARLANGKEVTARAFISDAHPAVTCSLMEPLLNRKMYVHRIQQLPNTQGMFTLSLSIRPGTLDYQNYNHYIYRTENVWDATADGSRVHSVMVSMLPPEEGKKDATVVDLLTPLSWEECKRWEDTTVKRRGKGYTYMKLRRAWDCVELASRVIPDLADRVDHFCSSSPLTWRDYTNTPEGAAFGIRKDYHQPMLSVLSPRTPIPNLYLTGQSLFHHGIMGTTLTALVTCAEIIGRDAVRTWLEGA
jgi:all-trans-retinol 13,14-reductase